MHTCRVLQSQRPPLNLCCRSGFLAKAPTGACRPRQGERIYRQFATKHNRKSKAKNLDATTVSSPVAHENVVVTPLQARMRAAKAARKLEEANQAQLLAKRKESFLMKHAAPLAFWTFGSVSLGVYLMNNDPSSGISETMDTTMKLLAVDDPHLVSSTLDDLARATAVNDTAKRLLVSSSDHFNQLLSLIEKGPTDEIRNNAAKCIENVCMLPENCEKIVGEGWHDAIIEQAAAPNRTLLCRKTLAAAIANMGQVESLHVRLAEAGGIYVVNAINSHQSLARKRVSVTLEKMAATVYHSAEAEQLKDSLNAEHWTLIESLAKQFDAERSKPFFDIKTTIIESGVLLYFHTAAGGAVWGAIESLRAQQPLKQIMKNSIRTSLVTSLVPIYAVGAVVSTFNHLQKRIDSEELKFLFYTGAGMSIFPLFRILPRVEAYAPNWLGGHIVGFCSFFIYMLITNNDLLRNDAELLQKDAQRHQRQARQQRLANSSEAAITTDTTPTAPVS